LTNNPLVNLFRIGELRKKILITIFLVLVYRLGSYIPTPGIDGNALALFFEELARKRGATLFGIMDLFSGGALTRLTIFALGIMPYISGSIIMQLLTAVVPFFEKMAKEGKTGYEKINQYTRYLTVGICLVQGFFIALWLENLSNQAGGFHSAIPIVPHPGWAFRIITVLTLVCGTVFVMWLGEQIQERGIGNGISLIIAIGIVSRIPHSLRELAILYSPLDPSKRQVDTVSLILLLVLWLALVVGVVLFTQAQRRVPVEYARRVVGRKVYGGQSTFLPIRVDMAGVIAIIFAQSVLLFPSTIAAFFPQGNWQQAVMSIFHEKNVWYNLIYVGLIVFFMYFYTAIVFNPLEISNNLKKYGGFVPGIRPGKPTAEYLDFVTTRLVFAGAVYIALIAVLPTLIMRGFGLPSYSIASFFGGTTLLIVVGVLLDTLRQLESQLLLRHYEGFMKGTRLRGRRA